jgi:serine/threonine-protein kinase HipA
VVVSNRDDHLRNHGFIFKHDGWSLSPAFDMNPYLEKSEYVLTIDDRDNRPNINTVLSTSDFYGVRLSQAKKLWMAYCMSFVSGRMKLEMSGCATVRLP